MSDEQPNYYAPPAVSLESAQAGAHSERELRAFIGPHASYFLRKWAPRLEGRGRAGGFSLALVPLGWAYFCYRKLYLHAFLAALPLLALGYGVDVCLAQAGLDPQWGLAFNALYFGILGLQFNDWYCTHALAKIQAAKAQGLEGDALLDALRRRGRTNLWLPGLFLVVLPALFLGLAIVAALAR